MQKMCKTRLALAGKCGGLGASGLVGWGQVGVAVDVLIRASSFGSQKTVAGPRVRSARSPPCLWPDAPESRGGRAGGEPGVLRIDRAC